MLVNRILQYEKINGLSNYKSNCEKDSTKDKNKSTVFLCQVICDVTPDDNNKTKMYR